MKDRKKEFEKIRCILRKEPDKFNRYFIWKQLKQQTSTRRVYLALVKVCPAKMSEIHEESMLTRATCYTHLYKLLDLGLVERIYILDIVVGKVKNDEVREKWLEWSKEMPEDLKRYYLAKTSYWMLTDFGMGFAEKAYHFDQEFREKEEKEGGGF